MISGFILVEKLEAPGVTTILLTDDLLVGVDLTRVELRKFVPELLAGIAAIRKHAKAKTQELQNFSE